MAEYPALDLTFRQDEGTSELVQLLYACLDDFEPYAIHEHESGDGLRVFFRGRSVRGAAADALGIRFGSRLVSVSIVDVADDGWARRSQAQLTAVRVGRIVVAPPWAPEAAARNAPVPEPGPAVPSGPGDLVVMIEPSMGFGTGHHATTRLCLHLLQRETLRERHVIDVGTGSGVLAIAAWALGAAAVAAVDCDPDALQNARENVRRNGAERSIRVVESDLSGLDHPAAHVVLANLTSSALQRHAAELLRLVLPDGRLVVSGFPPDDLRDIEGAFGRPAHESVKEQGWAAAVFTAITPTHLN